MKTASSRASRLHSEGMNAEIKAGHQEALFRAAKVYLDADGDFYDRRKGM